MLKIRTIGHPVLREKAKEVELPASVKDLVRDMNETMREAKGVGLAGNQVGILKQIFVYDVGDGPRVLINPEIAWKSPETVEDTEGCLSVPGVQVSVTRAARVRVRGVDLKGEAREIEVEGLAARVFQHEIDHLNGVLILDRTSDEERRRALEDMVWGDQG